MKIFFSILLLLPTIFLQAQTRLELADELYDNKAYSEAVTAYQKVLAGKVKDRMNISYKVAESYRYTGELEKSLEWYNRAKSEGYNQPNVLYQQAKIHMQQGNYTAAQEKLNEFLLKMPNDKDAVRMLNNAKYAASVTSQPTIFTVQNAASMNTPHNDYAANYFKNSMVFTSSRLNNADDNIYTFDGQGFSDFYTTQYNTKDKSWNKPEKITAINTSFNDGVFTYCEKTKAAYFMQCNGSNGKEDFCTIMESVYDEAQNKFSEPKVITTNITTKTDIGQPTISTDGQTLYFVSKMDGGIGSSDLWSLQKRGLQWENIENLGSVINTEFDEMFPVIFQDTILYFASEGHDGLGGLDIFSSIKRNGNWAKPQNLKTPFNSSSDDFYIVYNADKTEGYFTSNRPNGMGADDVYTFFITPILLNVKGSVTDVDNNSQLKNAMVVLTTDDGTTDTAYTNDNGEYEFKLDKNKNYKINVNTPSYFGDSKKLSTLGELFSKEFSKKNGNNYDFNIKKIPKEEIKIDDIYYDYNSFILRDESKPNLDKLVKLLEDTPEARIQLNAHTDERGKQPYNQLLSENRAKSVVDYLVLKGINPIRLSYKGWGSLQPVVKGAKTEEEHQMNRRTTFRVLN